jgi:CubicO group peptidase (beta-lactamase class C family)
MADVENSVPVTPSTVFRLASISKPISGTAALAMAEAGMLDLDAPIQRYVPVFPEKPGGVITPRLLLGHLSGIRQFQGAEADITHHYPNLTEPLSIFANDALLSEPGTAYNYSSLGFTLLGAAMENAAHEPFESILKRLVFTPAGMTTARADDTYALIPNRARGYNKAPEPNGENRIINAYLVDTSHKMAGGGLAATAEDVAKFALAVRAGKLVGASNTETAFAKEALWTSLKLTAGPDKGKQTGYGLGWAIERIGSRRVVGHLGGQHGASTMLLLEPESGHVAVVLSNLEGADIGSLTRRIMRVLLEGE